MHVTRMTIARFDLTMDATDKVCVAHVWRALAAIAFERMP